MRGDGAPIEQTGRSQPVDAGADTGNPSYRRRSLRDPARNAFAETVAPEPGTPRDNDGVEAQGCLQPGVGLHVHTAAGGERPPLEPDDRYLVRPPLEPGHRGECVGPKRVRRADEVHRLDIVEAEEADAQRSIHEAKTPILAP